MRYTRNIFYHQCATGIESRRSNIARCRAVSWYKPNGSKLPMSYAQSACIGLESVAVASNVNACVAVIRLAIERCGSPTADAVGEPRTPGRQVSSEHLPLRRGTTMDRRCERVYVNLTPVEKDRALDLAS